MVRVIATDLDGTLLKPKRKYSLIEKEIKKYIKNFYGDIVLVSGRNPKFCAKICNVLNIEHTFIALNGAVIVKNGDIIYHKSLNKVLLANMLEYLEENYDGYEFMLFDKYDNITCYSNIKKSSLMKKYFIHHLKNGKLHQKIKISNKKILKLLFDNTPIYKVIIYADQIDDIYENIYERFKEDYTFFQSSHSIEISPIGVDKGLALEYLINTTKVKNNEVYVVGDGANDITLFTKFSNSFAMNTSVNELKTKAKHTINKFCDLDDYTKLNGNFH